MRKARLKSPRARLVALALALGAAWQGCVPPADLGGFEAREAELDAASCEPDREGGVDGECPSAPTDEADASSDGGVAGRALTVNVGLTTTYFADGKSLPAGIYTLTYVDGCWKSGVVAWTVNLGGEGYWIVGGQPEQRLAMAPGSVGTFATLGAFGTYDECVAANVGRSGITFYFQGGPLGLKLESLDPLTLFILVEGGESVGGRSPTFQLTCGGSCP